MALGIAGLVAAALLGDDDGDPTGTGLRPTVNVDEPATAPPATGGTEPEPADSQDPAPTSPGSRRHGRRRRRARHQRPARPASDDDSFTGDDFGDEPTLTTAVAVIDIQQPDEGALPEPGDEPVELPVQVTTPAPPSTYAPVPFDDLGPDAVAELDGWNVSERDADHVVLTNGERVVELFVIDGVATADEALERFYDDVRPELEELTRSPIERLGAPSGRFVSVAGSRVRRDEGRPARHVDDVRVRSSPRSGPTAAQSCSTTSRDGSSSAGELAGDGQLLTAILAHA